MKKVPVYLPSFVGKPKVGEAIVYDDGVIIIELDSTSVGENLRKSLVEKSISGLSLDGEETPKGSTNG
jgi:hypothetical protein